MGDGFYGEYRKTLDLIVIPGVIAKGALIGLLARREIAFQDILRRRGNLQAMLAA